MTVKATKMTGYCSMGGPIVSCTDRCRAARASIRLYGEPGYAVSLAQVEKQRRLEAKYPVAYAADEQGAARKDERLYAGRPPFESLAGLQQPPQPVGLNPKDIGGRFLSYSMGPRQLGRSNDLRRAIGNTASLVNRLAIDGREKSLALTHLEEALFWANASIAREGK